MELKQWMTQKEAAKLLGVTKQAVSLNASTLQRRASEPIVSVVAIQNQEGTRVLNRKAKCVSIAAVHAMAINGRKFEIAEAIRTWAESNNIPMVALVVSRPETEFSKLLGCLSGVCAIVPQKIFSPYAVDFFIPALNLAIEYDERRHQQTVKQDKARQSKIETDYGVSFVRVEEGRELEALRHIIGLLFQSVS
jgi:hypothetical protein